MSGLKSIKLPDKVPSKVYIWWIQTRISRYYYDSVHYFISNPIFQIKRLFQWYVNVFRYDFDFDGHSLFAIIEYKLKRLEKCLLKGHAVQEPRDMKALRLAIKLACRLKEDKYEGIVFNQMDKKFGSFKNCPPKERLVYYKKADDKMKRDEKELYSILQKHLRNWWD